VLSAKGQTLVDLTFQDLSHQAALIGRYLVVTNDARVFPSEAMEPSDIQTVRSTSQIVRVRTPS